MSEQPTDAQIKEFWEWCGLEKPSCDRIGGCLHDILDFKTSCKCDDWHYPLIDLNNLFKYAVPKAFEVDYKKAYLAILRWITDYANYFGISTIEQDPALALFWALWQVKEDYSE